jgi:hypothetical protein
MKIVDIHTGLIRSRRSRHSQPKPAGLKMRVPIHSPATCPKNRMDKRSSGHAR